MIDTSRQRWAALSWAGACAVGFGLLAALVMTDAQFLLDLDQEISDWAEQVTSGAAWLETVLVWIGYLTGTIGKTVATALAVLALVFKGHRRAAIWTAGVMIATGILTTLLKLFVGRERPQWDDPVQTLSDNSFPSGHASGVAAAAGVAIVLSTMLVRRRGLRRMVVAGAVTVALLVGLDRILLGAHYLSDVLAGYLLGTFVVLVGLVVFDPQPKSSALVNDPLPEAFPSAVRSVAAILNPIKVDDAAAFRTMVEKLAEESGWEKVTWWETTVEDTGYGMAHEAAVSGADLVIAIGGDGTIRAVCEELAGTGIPVGIVPAGTGNLLARNLSIPLYLRAAVDVALNGQDRAIDMVSVTGDEMEDATFLVMAGMGFDAAMMEGVNEDFKKKIGWLAYAWSALKALMFPAIKVEVSIDGGPPTVHRARTVVIGNVGYLQAGMPLIPDASIDDGELDVLLVYPRRFLSWVPVAARILTRNKRNDETITRMTGRTVSVRATGAAPRQLDGDLIASGRELHAECLHGRLLVRVPR